VKAEVANLPSDIRLGLSRSQFEVEELPVGAGRSRSRQ